MREQLLRDLWEDRERLLKYGDAKRPVTLLFDNLLRDNSTEVVLELVAQGCEVILANARRLATDTACLLNSGGFSSASVLSLTVEEEIAKVLILLDLAKLDFCKHENFAKGLCRAFCSHTDKAARFAVLTKWHPETGMPGAKQTILDAKIEWKPADESSGQPSLASRHAYRRDFSLYADMDWTTGRWCMPNDAQSRAYFDPAFGGEWPDSLRQLGKLERDLNKGLFSPEAVAVVHEAYHHGTFLKEGSEQAFLRVLKKASHELIKRNIVQPCDIEEGSALLDPPMYAWIGKPLEYLRKG